MKNCYKTWFCPWCFTAVVVLCFVVTHGALAIPRLSIATVRGFPGNSVQVPVSLRFNTNDIRDVVALQADVAFDEMQGLMGGLTEGADLIGGHVLRSGMAGTGLRRMLFYALDNALMSNGVVANIPFAIPAGIRSNVRLTLSNVILATAEGVSVAVTPVSGVIVVNSVYVRPEDGNVEGFIDGLPDERTYVVQATENFSQWVNIATNASVGTFLDFVDLDAHLHPQRFYRAMSMAGSIVAAGKMAGSGFTVNLAAVSGRRYIVQASTNMTDWHDLESVTATGEFVNYTNTVGLGLTYHFFRLKPD